MDFRNCACKWVTSVNDRHTKFVTAYPLHGKKATQVLATPKVYCNTHGHPKQLLCDNGREFKNEMIQNFAKKNEHLSEFFMLVFPLFF